MQTELIAGVRVRDDDDEVLRLLAAVPPCYPGRVMCLAICNEDGEPYRLVRSLGVREWVHIGLALAAQGFRDQEQASEFADTAFDGLYVRVREACGLPTAGAVAALPVRAWRWTAEHWPAQDWRSGFAAARRA